MDSLIRGNDFAPFPSTGVRQRLEGEAVNFMDEGDTINGQPWQSYFKPEQYS